MQRYALTALALAALAAASVVGTSASSPSQQEIDILRGADAPPNAVWIDSLDLTRMVQRRQTPRAGKSLAGRGGGGPISLGGVTYAHGIGTLSINELIIDLKGQATRFLAMVGINDAASKQGSNCSERM